MSAKSDSTSFILFRILHFLDHIVLVFFFRKKVNRTETVIYRTTVCGILEKSKFYWYKHFSLGRSMYEEKFWSVHKV